MAEDDHPDLTVKNITDVIVDTVSSEPDATTRLEITNWELEEHKAKVRGVIQDIGERKKYAICIFVLVAVWLALMGSIILLQGFTIYRFTLSENVLIAVVTTTTAGVVGLLLVVVKYLFPSQS